MPDGMTDYSTIHISQCNIVGEGDDIKFVGDPALINDLKVRCGIDITNKNLLNHLKAYGRLKIVANKVYDLWASAPTDEELDKFEKEELNTARAAFKAANDVQDIPEMKEQ